MPAAVSSPKHPKPSPKTFEPQARKLLRAASEPCSTILFFWLSLLVHQNTRSHHQRHLNCKPENCWEPPASLVPPSFFWLSLRARRIPDPTARDLTCAPAVECRVSATGPPGNSLTLSKDALSLTLKNPRNYCPLDSKTELTICSH